MRWWLLAFLSLLGVASAEGAVPATGQQLRPFLFIDEPLLLRKRDSMATFALTVPADGGPIRPIPLQFDPTRLVAGAALQLGIADGAAVYISALLAQRFQDLASLGSATELGVRFAPRSNDPFQVALQGGVLREFGGHVGG